MQQAYSLHTDLPGCLINPQESKEEVASSKLGAPRSQLSLLLSSLPLPLHTRDWQLGGSGRGAEHAAPLCLVTRIPWGQACSPQPSCHVPAVCPLCSAEDKASSPLGFCLATVTLSHDVLVPLAASWTESNLWEAPHVLTSPCARAVSEQRSGTQDTANAGDSTDVHKASQHPHTAAGSSSFSGSKGGAEGAGVERRAEDRSQEARFLPFLTGAAPRQTCDRT